MTIIDDINTEGNVDVTDEVWDVTAVGKPACGTMIGRVNAVGRGICSSSGCKEIVVAIVNQGVSKNKECSSLCLRKFYNYPQ